MNELISQWNDSKVIERLKSLREDVLNEEYKRYRREWGGAGLIVTSDKEDKRKADIKIITKHAKPITYLLYKLKDIYKEHIDYSNKREFYAYVVNLVEKGKLEKEIDSKKILNTIIDKLLERRMDKENYKKWVEFLEKGLYSQESEFLRFAVLWLTLASFLNERYPKEEKEAGKLCKFKEDYSSFYKDLVQAELTFRDILTTEFSETKKSGREFVQNLQPGKEKVKYSFVKGDIQDFSKFINVIYQVRCNFFHGRKFPFDKEDKKLVKWAYNAFLYFWKKVLTDKFEVKFSEI